MAESESEESFLSFSWCWRSLGACSVTATINPNFSKNFRGRLPPVRPCAKCQLICACIQPRYRLLKRNQIPAFRIGTDWRFNIEAIDHWRLQQEKPGD
jgi:hypothetical protein